MKLGIVNWYVEGIVNDWDPFKSTCTEKYDFNEEKLLNLRNVHSDEEDQQKKRRKAGHLPSNREVL